MALRDVLREIRDQGGYDGSGPEPVVSLELFFDGNEDEASIAPNVEPHPGVANIARVLRGIRARADVHHVLVGVSEVMGDDEWPFADHVYVVTSASDDTIDDWADALGCDEPGEGWWTDSPPRNAPSVPPGARVITLWWD